MPGASTPQIHPTNTMKSAKRILMGTSIAALALYGSFVGLWTPPALEHFSAEHIGALHGVIRGALSLGVM